MKQILPAFAFAALVGLGVSLASAPVACQSCGVKPIKPIPPIGCSDLAASCVCDQSGKNCAWQWLCVPRAKVQ